MTLCREGRISLCCFAGTWSFVFTLTLLGPIVDGFVPMVWGAFLWGPLLYYFVINISLRLCFREQDYQV